LNCIENIWESSWQVLNGILCDICRSWENLRVNGWVERLTENNLDDDIGITLFKDSLNFCGSVSFFAFGRSALLGLRALSAIFL